MHAAHTIISSVAGGCTAEESVTSICRGLGDVLSQRIESRKKWNPKQTAFAAAFGGVVLGAFSLHSPTPLMGHLQ
jgi:hypothetical protein